MSERDVSTSMMSQSFAYGFRPIYYFARVAGQMPFTITHQPNSSIVKVNFHKRDFIWLVLSMCIQIYLSYLAIQMVRSTVHDQSKSETSTVHLGTLTIWLLTSLLGITAMILDTSNRFKIGEILNKITTFDKEVSK